VNLNPIRAVPILVLDTVLVRGKKLTNYRPLGKGGKRGEGKDEGKEKHVKAEIYSTTI
jgi:hypothetical protein